MENKKCIGAGAYKEFGSQIAVRGAAFTLVEVILVVSIIGLLAIFLIPSIARGMRYWENRAVAQKFQQAVLAFEEYHSDHGAWPANAYPGRIPTEMNANGGYYFKTHGIDWWEDDTGIGGSWDWDYYSSLGAYISIPNPTISDEQLVELDRILDDGSLTSGVFQKGVNSSYASDYSFIADLF